MPALKPVDDGDANGRRVEQAAFQLYKIGRQVATRYSGNIENVFFDDLQTGVLSRVKGLIRNGGLSLVVEENWGFNDSKLKIIIESLGKKIAKEAWIDALRKAQRQGYTSPLSDSEDEAVVEDSETPSEFVLLQFIECLPPDLKEQGSLLLSHLLLGMTNEEGSAELGIGVSTYRRLKKKVIDTIRTSGSS